MLYEGVIKERVIRVEEMVNAREFFLINSIQKWMRAVMSEAFSYKATRSPGRDEILPAVNSRS